MKNNSEAIEQLRKSLSENTGGKMDLVWGPQISISYSLPVKRLTDTAILPKRAYDDPENYDAGLDLFLDEDEVVLAPGERACLHTGISMAIPGGFMGLVWPRSGNAVKKGIDVLAGMIDSTYTGEVLVVLINHSNDCQIFKRADKIAQLIISPIPRFIPVEVSDLSDTSRGNGGFGSSDIKV